MPASWMRPWVRTVIWGGSRVSSGGVLGQEVEIAGEEMGSNNRWNLRYPISSPPLPHLHGPLRLKKGEGLSVGSVPEHCQSL